MSQTSCHTSVRWSGWTFLLVLCFAASASSQQKKPSPAPPQKAKPATARTSSSQRDQEPHEHDADDPRRREQWFYEQRAYPNKFIPGGARLKAFEQTEAMERAARDRRTGMTSTEAITASTMTWTPIGPQPTSSTSFGFTSGRVSTLAVDPANANIVYLGGAQGGVWRSNDGGQTWIPLTDNQPSLAVGSIALDPTTCNSTGCLTIYVGTGEEVFSLDSYYGAGVLKSTDGGNTWTQLGKAVFGVPINGGVGGARIGSMAIDPTNNQHLFAAVQKLVNVDTGISSGVYESNDGGATWTQAVMGAPGRNVFFDPLNQNIAYASLGNVRGDVDNGIYKFTRGAATPWQRVLGTGLPTANVGRIELVAGVRNNATVLFAGIQDSSSATFGNLLGFFVSTDGGTTWTRLSNTPDYCTAQCWYDQVIRVHPNNGNVVYVGGSATANYLARSTDGGNTWTAISVGSNNVRPHVDQHAMAFGFTGTTATTLYIGNDGGIWSADVTTPAGAINWTNLNNTLALTQFYPGHSIHPSSQNIGLGGTQDNSTQTYTGGLQWQTVTCGDGGWTGIDPLTPSTVYATCQDIDVRRSLQNGNLSTFVSADNGIDQTDDVAFIPPFVPDPGFAGRLYFGTFRVYQTMNMGDLWQAISPDLTGGIGVLSTIAVAFIDPDWVYVGTSNGRVQVTSNANSGTGAAWVDRSAGLPNRAVTQIAVTPGTTRTAYVAFSGFAFGSDLQGHLFKTMDAGVTWRDVSCSVADCRTPALTDLPNTPVNDVVIDPDIPGTLYVATDVGVFMSSDDGGTWTPLATSLPKVAVFSLVLHRASRTLRAATHGRSVWDLQLPDPRPFFLGSLSPVTAVARTTGLTLTLNGAGFTPQSLVQWNGVNLPTPTFVNANQLTASVPDANLASAGVELINVADVNQVGVLSNLLRFTVTGAVPTLTSINPTSAAQGSAATQITATGTNFVSGISFLRFNGTDIAATVDSPTQLRATVPASMLAAGGFFRVSVFNTPPGGGVTLPPLNFTVTAPAPPNDNFANAITINGNTFTDTQNNVGATTEINDPNPSTQAACPQAGRNFSIWYRFTPSVNGLAVVTTFGTNYDTVLSVWTGPALGSLTGVACDDDGIAPGGASLLFVNLNAGTTYHFMITGFGPMDAGSTVFTFLFSPPPPNDNFFNATVVGAVPFTDMVISVAATTETNDPTPPTPACTSGAASNGRAKSVWYRITASAAGTITADTFGSGYDTILSVWTGSFGALTPAACNDDTGGVQSQASFAATANTTYHFMVTDFDGVGGTTVFHITAAPAPGPDISVSASPSNVTVTRGSSATATVSIAGFAGFSGNVALSCSGLPSRATCSFNPASVAPGTPSTVTFTAATAAAASPALTPPSVVPGVPPALLSLCAAGLALVFLLTSRWTSKRPRLAGAMVLLLVLLLALIQVACGGGGGGSSPPPPPPPQPGTPPGTYSITVTGTSGTLSRSTILTLIVN